MRNKLFPLGILLIAYFAVIFGWGYHELVKESMFYTVDSRSYLAVADWLRGDLEETPYLFKRPLLYPLVLVATQAFDRITGPWLLQFLLWCFTGWLIYFLVLKITGKPWLALLLLLVYATNVSAILLTINALTETITMAGSVVLVWLVIERNRVGKSWFAVLTLFVLALLTVIKPLYLYLIPPFGIIVLLGSLDRSNWKRILIGSVLALLPVMAQFLVIHAESGKWSISNIGEHTYKYYFFTELFAKTNNLEIIDAKEIVAPMLKAEIITYSKAHFKEAFSIYWLNFEGNINTNSSMTHIPIKMDGLDKYMRKVNNVYWVAILLGLACSFFVLVFHLMKRNWSILFPILLLLLLLCIVLFTAPITFWQGDRIVLPALPVWLVLFTCVFMETLNILGQKIQSGKSMQ